MTVKKKLQRLGNSRVLLIDGDLLSAFLPDGDFDQELTVSAQRGELVVRPVVMRPVEPEGGAPRALPPLEGLSDMERAILRELATGAGNTTEVARRVGGASLPTFSRALSALARSGWVRKTARDWHVTDAAREQLT